MKDLDELKYFFGMRQHNKKWVHYKYPMIGRISNVKLQDNRHPMDPNVKLVSNQRKPLQIWKVHMVDREVELPFWYLYEYPVHSRRSKFLNLCKIHWNTMTCINQYIKQALEKLFCMMTKDTLIVGMKTKVHLWFLYTCQR